MSNSSKLVRSLRANVLWPRLVKDTEEKVKVIRENLKLAQMKQKSYHDKRTTPRHYEVGDYVYLKVSPTKGVHRFGVRGKLAPRYIGPYEIIKVCGPVAYRIRLPGRFSVVCNLFHVTQLKKGLKVPETEVITEVNTWIEPNISCWASVESARSKRKKNQKTYREVLQDTMESPYWRRSYLGDRAFSQHQVSRYPSIAKQ
jgi:hypothetical protein